MLNDNNSRLWFPFPGPSDAQSNKMASLIGLCEDAGIPGPCWFKLEGEQSLNTPGNFRAEWLAGPLSLIVDFMQDGSLGVYHSIGNDEYEKDSAEVADIERSVSLFAVAFKSEKQKWDPAHVE